MPEIEASHGFEPGAPDSPYRVLTNLAGGKDSIGLARAEFDAVVVEVGARCHYNIRATTETKLVLVNSSFVHPNEAWVAY